MWRLAMKKSFFSKCPECGEKDDITPISLFELQCNACGTKTNPKGFLWSKINYFAKFIEGKFAGKKLIIVFIIDESRSMLHMQKNISRLYQRFINN